MKRLLDGRRRIPLAYRGESRFHTSATVNIAELIRVALESSTTQVLNAADPEALSVTEIGRVVAELYGAAPELVLLDGAPKGGVGATPWSGPRPLIADMSRAEALGYEYRVRILAERSASSGRASDARCASSLSHNSTTNTVSGLSSLVPTS